MDWIGEALSLVFGVATLWQRGKAKRAQLDAEKAQAAAKKARAEQERLKAELDLIRTKAGTKASWER